MCVCVCVCHTYQWQAYIGGVDVLSEPLCVEQVYTKHLYVTHTHTHTHTRTQSCEVSVRPHTHTRQYTVCSQRTSATEHWKAGQREGVVCCVRTSPWRAAPDKVRQGRQGMCLTLCVSCQSYTHTHTHAHTHTHTFACPYLHVWCQSALLSSSCVDHIQMITPCHTRHENEVRIVAHYDCTHTHTNTHTHTHTDTCLAMAACRDARTFIQDTCCCPCRVQACVLQTLPVWCMVQCMTHGQSKEPCVCYEKGCDVAFMTPASSMVRHAVRMTMQRTHHVCRWGQVDASGGRDDLRS